VVVRGACYFSSVLTSFPRTRVLHPTPPRFSPPPCRSWQWRRVVVPNFVVKRADSAPSVRRTGVGGAARCDRRWSDLFERESPMRYSAVAAAAASPAVPTAPQSAFPSASPRRFIARAAAVAALIVGGVLVSAMPAQAIVAPSPVPVPSVTSTNYLVDVGGVQEIADPQTVLPADLPAGGGEGLAATGGGTNLVPLGVSALGAILLGATAVTLHRRRVLARRPRD